MPEKSELKVKGSTGETCQISGVYFCPDNDHSEILVVKGERFPLCLEGVHKTEWVLKRGKEKQN